MSRYIDTKLIPALFDEEFKKTRKLIIEGETHLDNLAEGFLEADRVIQGMPTADVVEVVRCKDCRHWVTGGYDPIISRDFGSCTCEYWEHPSEYYETSGNDFCSHGERSEGDENH